MNCDSIRQINTVICNHKTIKAVVIDIFDKRIIFRTDCFEEIEKEEQQTYRGPSFFISINLCIENKRKQAGDVHLCIGRRITIAQAASEAEAALVKDSNGNVLQDGDTVVIIKDLKVKGATSALKKGTKVKNIRLVDDGTHNIDCNIPGFGAMSLKSEFVKKA